MKWVMMVFLVVISTIPCYSGIKYLVSDSGEVHYKLTSFTEEEINYAKGIKPARDSWSTQDTILELSFLVLAGIDLWQTYTFLYKDNESESLELLGNKPSKKELFLKAGLWGLGHVGISYIIPNRYLRNLWQLAGIVIHFNAIGRNYSLGVRISI